MATIPDLTGLAREDLDAVIQAAHQEIEAIRQQKRLEVDQRRAVEAELVDPSKLTNQIAVLIEQIARLQGVLDTPNADINSSPAPAIKTTARATKRVAVNTVRALRVIGGLLDSTELGDDGA